MTSGDFDLNRSFDHLSAGVLLASSDFDNFLFQINDDRHPDIRCRGKIQLWGGRMEEGDNDSPHRTLERELSEEWRDQCIVDEVLKYAGTQSPRFFALSSSGGTATPYMYGMHVFVVVVPRETFMRWFSCLEKAGFNEGRMELLTRLTVDHYISDVDKQRLFLGNLQEVLRCYLAPEIPARRTSHPPRLQSRS